MTFHISKHGSSSLPIFLFLSLSSTLDTRVGRRQHQITNCVRAHPGDWPHNPAPLGSLPEELHLAINEKLPMASLFALSCTSHQFRRLADPFDESRRCALEDFLVEAQYFAR